MPLRRGLQVAFFSGFAVEKRRVVGKKDRMGKRGNSSGSRSGASNRAKRSKAEAPPEANPHTLKWSDLHYDVVRDIFRHLPTTKQARCRRVCAGWNSLLVEQLSLSSVMSLQYHDLKKWKTIFCPPARETRGAIRMSKVKLVSEQTRTLIIDFGNIELQLTWESQQQVFGLSSKGNEPFVYMTQNHPQINRVVAQRARVGAVYSQCLMGNYFVDFLDFLGVGSCLATGMSVAVLECATTQPASLIRMWVTGEEFVDIDAWTWPWPNLTITDPEPLPEDKHEYKSEVLEQYYLVYWPYPPEQLEWLEACLGKLPTKDLLFDYLRMSTWYTFNEKHEKQIKRYCVTLLGENHLKSTAAFCARYLTTFRQYLNLPPPPHPLVWKD